MCQTPGQCFINSILLYSHNFLKQALVLSLFCKGGNRGSVCYLAYKQPSRNLISKRDHISSFTPNVEFWVHIPLSCTTWDHLLGTHFSPEDSGYYCKHRYYYKQSRLHEQNRMIQCISAGLWKRCVQQQTQDCRVPCSTAMPVLYHVCV